MVTRLVLLCAALFASGCEDFDRLAQLKPRRLTFRVNDTFHSRTGQSINVPFTGAVGAPCQGWVDVPLGEGPTPVNGILIAAGVCEARDVPPGDVLLRTELPGATRWYQVTGEDIDMGLDLFGPRTYPIAAARSLLTLDLTNANTVSDTTVLMTYQPDFSIGYNVEGFGVRPDSPSTTSSFSYTLGIAGQPLLEANEPLHVYQGEYIATTHDYFWQLAKHGTAAVKWPSGSAARASVALANLQAATTPLPPMTVDAVKLNGAIGVELDRPSTFVNARVRRDAWPQGSTLGFALQAVGEGDQTKVVTLPAYPFEPLSGDSWAPMLVVSSRWQTEVKTFDGSRSGLISGGFVRGPVDTTDWQTSAVVTPVRNLQVSAGGVAVPQNGIVASSRPTITWSPPRVGQPTRYYVTIWQLDGNGTDIDFTLLSDSFVVTRPSFRVPAAILKTGSEYVVQVAASTCNTAPVTGMRRYQAAPACGESYAIGSVFSVGYGTD